MLESVQGCRCGIGYLGKSAILTAVAVLFAATPWRPYLFAQTIHGGVADSASAEPLAGVTIELRLPNNQTASRESSDQAGQFRLRANAAGTYRVRASRIGYREFESEPINLEGQTDTTLRILLAPLAVQIDPVTVATPAMNSYLRTSGFYGRKEGGIGHFLDPEVVQKLAPKARLGVDIIVGVPGVRLGRVRGIPIPQLRTCRTLRSVQFTSADAAQLYLDGILVEPEALAMLTPDDILAVEVFMGPAEVPLQYGGTNAPCGVILVWTKQR